MGTTISRTWYDTLVDDSGSGTDGTILDKADFDAILDAIDALFVSALAIDSDLILTGNNAIRRNTSDGTDNGFLGLAGGGSGTSARGAVLTLAGNEYGGGFGLARIEIGDVAGGKFVVQRGAGTSAVEVAGASGAVYINDNANANMTLGLTINQGAADDQIAAFKSSDVAHGGTTTVETDTFGDASKINAAGGLRLRGFDGSGSNAGLLLVGGLVTEDGSRSTSAQANVMISGMTKTGTTFGDMAADRNLLAVRANTTTRFVLDSDGDSHQDVGTAWTNFDAENDVAVLNLLAASVTRPDDPLRRHFGQWLLQGREPLERLRLVSFNEDGHHFVNMSRLTMLLVGAVRQIGHELERLEQCYLALEDRHG